MHGQQNVKIFSNVIKFVFWIVICFTVVIVLTCYAADCFEGVVMSTERTP